MRARGSRRSSPSARRISRVHDAVSAARALTERWWLVGDVHQRRLTDAAVRSPIVEQRTGTYASLGLAYRF
ncbi:MAG TPA: MipA/OmpV family protein [Burkholderiales bacterium]|nr:MipA/OmpV family protein [Burkholderiales bacterium]